MVYFRRQSLNGASRKGFKLLQSENYIVPLRHIKSS